MDCRLVLLVVLPLACITIIADGQAVETRIFTHNTPISDALPTNLQLPHALKTVLKLQHPKDFEKTVLNNTYRFKNGEYLLKALLHESYERKLSKEMRDSYQPLDQIGTMVVDYMFMRHLLLNMRAVNSQQLSTMKNALVHRDTIAFTALKAGFKKFIIIDPSLLDASSLKPFMSAVDSNALYQDIVAEIPDMTKRPHSGNFIHRMFKAVIGAVYVDSGYSMETVDGVFMPLFKKELDRVISKVVWRKQKVL